MLNGAHLSLFQSFVLKVMHFTVMGFTRLLKYFFPSIFVKDFRFLVTMILTTSTPPYLVYKIKKKVIKIGLACFPVGHSWNKSITTNISLVKKIFL